LHLSEKDMAGFDFIHYFLATILAIISIDYK
jgi:hypothetical protein